MLTEYIAQLSLEVKSKLPEYVRSKGKNIERNGQFSCVLTQNHTHGDINPSASLLRMPNGIYKWKCHKCKVGGTIYDMVRLLENRGDRGSEFITTTIYLANLLGIEVDLSKLPDHIRDSEKEANEVASLMDVYEEIDSIIVSQSKSLLTPVGEGPAYSALMNGNFGRTYTADHAQKVLDNMPCAVLNAGDLYTHLCTKFGEDSVKKLPFFYKAENGYPDRLDSLLFSKDSLTFSIKDESGIPIGFASRLSLSRLQIAKEKGQKISKYKFAAGAKSYKKRTMFLIHEAEEHIRDIRKVIIVEGQFDAASCHAIGIKNVISLMGSSISQEILGYLMGIGTYAIIFALDNDTAGLNGVKSAIDLANGFPMSVLVSVLPEDQDPDTLATVNPETLRTTLQKTMDGIEYILRYDSTIGTKLPHDVRYQKMVEYVAINFPTQPKIRKYAIVISELIGESVEDILKDIENQIKGLETRNTEADRIWAELDKAKSLPLVDRVFAINKTAESLRGLVAKKDENIFKYTWNHFLSLARREYTLPNIFTTGHPALDAAVSIESGSLSVWSGYPSNGKSSILRGLSIDMADHHDDIYITYISTDDVVSKAMLSYVSLITQIDKTRIRTFMDRGTLTEAQDMRNHIDHLQDIFTNKMCIVGIDKCPNLASVRSHVETIRTTHPKKKVMVILDAMNNLSDITDPKKGDQRVAIEGVIRELKSMSAIYDVSTNAVLHLSKHDGNLKQRPQLHKLKGSSFIEYEAKSIVFMHMDLHLNRHSELIWRTSDGFLAPIVEVWIAKDKDKKANDVIPFKFDPRYGGIELPNRVEMEEYMKIIDAATGNTRGEQDGEPTDNIL